MSMTQLTNAVATVTLRDGDGERQVRFRQINDRDTAELDEWVRDRYLSQAFKSADALSVERRKEVIEVASQTAMTLTFYSPLGMRIMATPEGITQWIWQLARDVNDDLTIDDLRRMTMHPHNVERWNEAFTRTHDLSPTQKKSNTSKTRRQTRSSTKSRTRKRSTKTRR